jgi:hypothetical protein
MVEEVILFKLSDGAARIVVGYWVYQIVLVVLAFKIGPLAYA